MRKHLVFFNLQGETEIIMQVFYQPAYFSRHEQVKIILIYLYHVISLLLLNQYILGFSGLSLYGKDTGQLICKF